MTIPCRAATLDGVAEHPRRADETLVVSVVLRPGARDNPHVEQLIATALELGLEESGRGRATVTFRTTGDNFERLFDVDSRDPGDVPVPGEFELLVESVSVEPPAEYF